MKLLLAALALLICADGMPAGGFDNIAFWQMIEDLGDNIYLKPDERIGALVAKYDPKSGMNPEELGEYAEGDILFPTMKVHARNGLKAQSARWPGAIVPFQISPGFSKADERMIRNGMEEYHKHTCIRFVPRKADDRDYLDITNAHTGCWSSVGRVGGPQTVNLQSPGCLNTLGTPMHELMHSVGFMHEQNRYERDDYVRINYEHIMSGTENNFQKESESMVYGQGVPYDYRSIMHYSAKAFSRDGKETITPKRSTGVHLGQRAGFSDGDKKKLNTMYQCKGGKTMLTD